MPILGAHMSIAGGFHRAVDRAEETGCDCVQIFTGSPRQHDRTRIDPRSGRVQSKRNNRWQSWPIAAADARRFRQRLEASGIGHPIAHASYLLNLAAVDDELWQKSIASLVVELQRAHQLGIPYVVLHPGSHTVSSEQAGLARVAAALDEVHRQSGELDSCVLLESTAGQGTNLGWRFEQLAAIIAAVADSPRLGVCLDTCHLHAAGYDLTTKPKFLATMRELDRSVGIDRVRAVHLNDSKGALGSRLDRHENIGAGQLGLEPFRLLLHDRRFRSIPMYLETPKGDNAEGELWDVVNLRTLRQLAGGPKNRLEERPPCYGANDE